ncbi:hypothetical protein ANCCAN_17928 [Ancylostoma caninum]|uniref:Uncharacterized protein n=1 Tax=Ancylostoma caninum TaxID=29170 RepID=A0A368FVQ4_ANCCA|nr:hypothetical protein ANCCAN_17928 [Ancylostoma caninum]
MERSIWNPWWGVGGKDAASIFDNAGLIVLTDAFLYRQPEPQSAFVLRFSREVPEFLRESWRFTQRWWNWPLYFWFSCFNHPPKTCVFHLRLHVDVLCFLLTNMLITTK